MIERSLHARGGWLIPAATKRRREGKGPVFVELDVDACLSHLDLVVEAKAVVGFAFGAGGGWRGRSWEIGERDVELFKNGGLVVFDVVHCGESGELGGGGVDVCGGGVKSVWVGIGGCVGGV